MASPVGWRIHRGSEITRFSDGLVIQRAQRPGILDLSICRVAHGDRSSPYSSRSSPGSLGLLRPLIAACTSEGIRRDTGVVTWLHWPNLVKVDDKAVARTSMSAGSQALPDGALNVVFEVSVNCFANASTLLSPSREERKLPFLSSSSSSILRVLGAEIDLNLLRDKILQALDWYFAEWERGMHQKLVERMEPTIPWIGRDVEIAMVDGRTLEGTARALQADGSLLLLLPPPPLRQRHVLRGDGEKSLKMMTSRIHPERVESVRMARE